MSYLAHPGVRGWLRACLKLMPYFQWQQCTVTLNMLNSNFAIYYLLLSLFLLFEIIFMRVTLCDFCGKLHKIFKGMCKHQNRAFQPAAHGPHAARERTEKNRPNVKYMKKVNKNHQIVIQFSKACEFFACLFISLHNGKDIWLATDLWPVRRLN